MVATGRGAEHGIPIEGGEALQRARAIGTVVPDAGIGAGQAEGICDELTALPYQHMR